MSNVEWSFENSLRQLTIYYESKKITASKENFNLDDLTRLIERLDINTDFIDPFWCAINKSDHNLASKLLGPSVLFLVKEIAKLEEGDEMKNTRKNQLEILKEMPQYIAELKNNEQRQR